MHRETYTKGTWYRGFGRNVILRKSCGQCLFNKRPRQGDLTMGDYWGIDAVSPELNDGRGTSVVLVNTEKGQAFLEKVRRAFKTLKKLPLKSTLRGNPNITTPLAEHENRANFFSKDRKRFPWSKAWVPPVPMLPWADFRPLSYGRPHRGKPIVPGHVAASAKAASVPFPPGFAPYPLSVSSARRRSCAMVSSDGGTACMAVRPRESVLPVP